MKVVGWIGAWTLYWLGDAASRILELNDDSEHWVAFWYPVYNDLMLASSLVQDKYKLDGPWESVSDDQ
jgi:hypothetical protein